MPRSLRPVSASILLATTTLGLALGATTAIFSTLYAVVLAPLPYQDADHIVQLSSLREGQNAPPGDFSLDEFDDWRSSTRTLLNVSAYAVDQFSQVQQNDAAVEVTGAIVSDAFFSLLGTFPRLGRYLGGPASRSPEAVISERMWRARFAADPAIVGRTILLSGRSWTIVGVAPAAFQLPSEAVEVWLNMRVVRQTAPAQWKMRGFRSFGVLARLGPGVSLEAARQDAEDIMRRWREAYPQFSDGLLASVTPLPVKITGDIAPVLWLLTAAGGLVLLIACVNLVNLLMAGHVSREREYAVRVALGAGRWHILRITLLQAFGIAGAGGVVGLALAGGVLRAFRAMAPAGIPRADDAAVSVEVIGFATALVFLVALVVGSLTGIRAWRVATTAALADARSGTNSRSRSFHSALVVTQVALSLVLVVNASLLVRSLSALMSTDTGVGQTGIVTLKLSAVGRGFLDRALPRIGAIPGVQSAGVISSLPPNGSQMRTTVSAVSTSSGQPVDASVDIVSVSPGALQTLGVTLTAGRLFTDADLNSTARPIIISHSTADRLFPGVDPVGRSLPFGPQAPSRPPQQVIGVVAPVRYSGLDNPADGAIYMPYTARPFAVTYLVVRGNQDTGALGAAVRAVARSVDPTQAVSEARPLGEVIAGSVAGPRVRAWLISALAAMALVIAAMGLYAVMSHAVGMRSVELGIRMALGASGGMLRRHVLREGISLAFTGALIGVPAAYAGARVMSRYLYGITTADPLSMVSAVVVLAGSALAATWIPALRASRVSPLEALRR